MSDKAFKDSFQLRNEHGSITVEIEIEPIDGPTRSAINPRKVIKTGDRLSITAHGPGFGGQSIDMLREIGQGLPAILALADTWDRWHLNDTKAGTVKQTEALSDLDAKGLDYYRAAMSHLEAKGLLVDRGYSYGSAWLLEPLPVDAIRNAWNDAKAAAAAEMAKREAMLAKAEEDSESDEAEDTRTPAEIIGEERGIDPDLLKPLADHLNVSLDDAADYHEENYQGEWRSVAEWAQQLANDLDMIQKAATWPNNHIDWESAANELLSSDYFELDGCHIYRNN